MITWDHKRSLCRRAPTRRWVRSPACSRCTWPSGGATTWWRRCCASAVRMWRLAAPTARRWLTWRPRAAVSTRSTYCSTAGRRPTPAMRPAAHRCTASPARRRRPTATPASQTCWPGAAPTSTPPTAPAGRRCTAPRWRATRRWWRCCWRAGRTVTGRRRARAGTHP